jgi:NAD(P)-dependent dehydrogenase (short-subunit alcohol dehydrogenase family)
MAPSDPRTVVITGASAGVGRAIALKFAREGARVALIGRSVAGLVSGRGEIKGLGGQAIAVPLDLSNPEEVYRAADEIAECCGTIDILGFDHFSSADLAGAAEMFVAGLRAGGGDSESSGAY